MKNRSLFAVIISVALCVCLSVTAVFAINGSFKTDSGSHLNLRIEWDVSQEDGKDTALVTAKVYLDCYSISVGARTGSTLSINGDAKTFDTPAISYSDNIKHSVLLAEHSAAVDRKAGSTAECEIKADWTFNGVYGGKKIGVLSAAQKLTITDKGVSAQNTSSGTTAAETTAAVTTPETTAPATSPSGDGTATGGAVYSKLLTFTSESGTRLNLVCELQASDSIETQGKITVAATLYLDYYSLYMSGRNGCSFTLGDKTVTFDVPAVNEETNASHRVKLASITLECDKGATLPLSASVPFNGVYAKTAIGDLTISAKAEIAG